MVIGQYLIYDKKQHPGHTLYAKFDSISKILLADSLSPLPHTPLPPPLPLVSYRIYLTIVTMYKVVIRPEQKTTPNIKERGLIDMVNL